MNKKNLLGLIFLSLSVATISLPLMPSEAKAWGYNSPYPVAGDACTKERGNPYWRCYRTPGGDHGVRIRVGNRRIRF